MCGKFTAMASWAEVVAFSQPLTTKPDDRAVTLRVMSTLPVILLDPQSGQRRVMPMRWGFPHRSNPNRPEPIHARAETIDERPTFKDAFLDGQRGIVLVRTFNEGKELETGKTEQHTIAFGDQQAAGIAFLWRRFAFNPVALTACVMVTVPASALIASITDRMPAILRPQDWAKWLGEEPASVEELKACLQTNEDPTWTMRPEDRPHRKPTVSNPAGLL
jgi:putative SOS response-associated peptidase YedK